MEIVCVSTPQRSRNRSSKNAVVVFPEPEGPASRITGRSAAVCRIFARFQLAGGDFQCDLLHGIAELLYHEDSALFRQGYYADTAGVVYHITLYLLAVLQFRCVPRHVENFALIGLFASGCFFL